MGCAASTTEASYSGTVHPPPKETYPRQHQAPPQHQHAPQHQPYQQHHQQYPQHQTFPQHHQPYPGQQQPQTHPQQPPPPYSAQPPHPQAPPQPPVQQQQPPQPSVHQQQPPTAQPVLKAETTPAKQPEQEGKAADVEFNEALVTTLLQLEQGISQLEKRNLFKQYKMKYEQLVTLTAQVKQLSDQQKQLEAQTLKEYQDVVDLQNNRSVRDMMSQMQFDQQMTKEQQEYMDALNKQEMHKNQLEAVTRQEASMRVEVTQLHQSSEELKALYDKQDNILSSIFDGKYGSELEYKLETELDMMMERKQRVAVAKYKWKNSKILIQHACSQFGFAVRRWNDLLQVPPTNATLRYQFAAEARNNLVAGLQNVDGAQRYLNTIKFPYCTLDEIKTVNTALQYIFTDMNTAERHKTALDCYMTMYKRSAVLMQWFDRIINKTILTDLDKASKECAAKQRELKLERMKLIREKIREKAGDEVANKLEITEVTEEDGETEDSELVDLVEADNVSQAGDNTEGLGSDEAGTGPTPLPTEELAATPSMNDIFGNIEDLKKQHEEQMKQITEQQELSKARANEDLQAKLAQRRSRRNRMAQQEAEMEALGSK
ncbi:uncharacterized protein [Apostichopus japonicus]|uniref:uncharacterized protein isoform X1 n=1 Tax=Stichopus japonicus TaxID=307972 RepID=UPI003AB4CD69